jgi:hypothetical protein
MQNDSLKKLYVDELKDLYSAENQLVKALPKMAKAASSEKLRQGFEGHLEQTKGHVQRLEKIFQSLDESPKGKKCVGMEGLVKEGSEAMEFSAINDPGLGHIHGDVCQNVALSAAGRSPQRVDSFLRSGFHFRFAGVALAGFFKPPLWNSLPSSKVYITLPAWFFLGNLAVASIALSRMTNGSGVCLLPS